MKKIYLLFQLFFIWSCSDVIYDADTINLYKPNPPLPWTIMIYLNGDNNLEKNILNNIESMKRGMEQDRQLYLVVLVDRISGYNANTTILGDNFSGTRLYDIRNRKALRITGRDVFPIITHTTEDELDMGSAETLGKFIKFCKKYYPAQNYALIIGDHGYGTQGISDDFTSSSKISPASFTEVLTVNESVDIIGFDACFMGCIEVAYQLRPLTDRFSSQYMVASAPQEWAPGWDYERILRRISNSGGYNGETDDTSGSPELIIPSVYLTPVELGRMIVEEFRDFSVEAYDKIAGYGFDTRLHSIVLLDLQQVEAIKNEVDNLAILLDKGTSADSATAVDTLRNQITINYYKSSPDIFPYFDLYNLAEKASSGLLENAIKSGIVTSFGGTGFESFTQGNNGLSIFFPLSSTDYKNQIWYYPYNSSDAVTGKLEWCAGVPDNGIKCWTELIDYCYDGSPGNGYSP